MNGTIARLEQLVRNTRRILRELERELSEIKRKNNE